MQTGSALSTKTALLAVLSVLLLCACGGGASAVRHYVIDAVAQPGYAPTTSGQPLAVEIIDLSVPQYLERAPIATRIGNNQMEFSETHRWGENLRKNLLRTLARNLSILLASNDVATPISRSSSTPDYRLQVHIEQFEQDASGIVHLLARWQVSDGVAAEPFGTYSATLSGDSSIEDGNYEAIVADMQRLYSDLSSRIVETILSAESR